MELLCYPMLLFVPYKFCCQLHLLLLFSVAVVLLQTILIFRRRISELTCQSNQHLHGQTAFFHYLPPTFGLSAKRLANRVITLRNHALLPRRYRSEEHTSELQSRPHLVCRLLLEKKKKK